MTRPLRDESGFTLVEVMVVAALFTVVMGALLSVFDTFQKTSVGNQKQNDAQDAVRVSVDSITRELRNLASPTNTQPQSVLRAGPSDLIFRSVAPKKPAGSLNTLNTWHVRYCVTSGGALWREQQTWTGATAPAWPTTTDCPGLPSAWPTQSLMVRNVANGTRPAFTYNSAALTSITEIAASLFIDTDRGHSTKEVTLQSAVFLRNQNRFPTAEFDMQVSGGTLVLNGSASSDPEGRALSFYWYDEALSTNSCGTLKAGIPTAGCVGQGSVYNYTPPATGSRTMHLIVADPGDLQAQAPSQTKCVGACP
jgi:prepilin-type N-terminal cleavage/methylation domain-containing protein